MTTIESYIERVEAERQRAVNEADALLAETEGAGRLMNAEEQAKWDRIMGSGGAVDQLREQRDQMIQRVTAEREAETARAAYEPIVRPEVQDRQSQDEVERFASFMRGESRGNTDDSPKAWDIDWTSVKREKALIRAGADAREIRVHTVGSNAAGGYLVPTDLMRTLYDYMENVSGVRRAGATIITTSAGNNQDLPIVLNHGSAAIVGESTALAAADASFTKITLGAYKYGQLTQVSHEELQDNAVDLTGFLGKDWGRALGRATEAHYISGSGTNQPQGSCLASVVGTGVTLQTSATGVPSYGNLVSLVYSVENIYRDLGAAWLMQDSFAGVIRKLTDSNGQPLWRPGFQYGMTGPAPDDLLGFPIYTTPFLTAVGTAAGTPMAFGNWSDGYVIRDAGNVRIERSDEFAFSTDLVTFRAIIRTDAKVRDQRAINVALAPTT